MFLVTGVPGVPGVPDQPGTPTKPESVRLKQTGLCLDRDGHQLARPVTVWWFGQKKLDGHFSLTDSGTRGVP